MGHVIQMERTRKQVIDSKCKRLVEPAHPVAGDGASGGAASGGDTRALNWLVPPSATEWPVNCGAQPELCEVVKKVHKERAIMAAVCNRNILGMLGQYAATHACTPHPKPLPTSPILRALTFSLSCSGLSTQCSPLA